MKFITNIKVLIELDKHIIIIYWHKVKKYS
jgi:hypothetical protein